MPKPHLPRLSLLFALLLSVASACNDEQLSVRAPLLGAREGSKVDVSGRADYLLDFGEVAVGSVSSESFYVTNFGLAALTLDPPVVAAPFGTELKCPRVVPLSESAGVAFLFQPDGIGPAETIVTLTSDGGQLKLRLTGVGREPLPTDCSFDFSPKRLDFGAVGPTQAKRLELRIVNKGENACTLSRLSLSGATDAGFTIVGDGVASQEISAFNDYTVAVEFKATRYAVSFSGTLQFGMGPPMASQQVPLTASSPEPCPGALADGSCPVATEKVYVNDASKLYKWDPAANQLAALGSFGSSVSGMTDIAIDSNGTMIGCDGDKNLYVINPTNAAVRKLATMANDANGLTFLPDGRLVASGAGVWAIDRTNGQVTETIVTAGRFDTSGDIIGLPDGKLYWVVRGTSGDQLVRIDPSSGSTTLVGSLSLARIWGVGYANGSLYGFGSDSVITVDPATAQTSLTRSLSGAWWGATTNPVTW